MEKYDAMMDYVAKIYIKALNAIHYMHDKYSYEALEMALHDRKIYRTMACGIAGFSVACDSLSAIKYAKVKVIRNEQGLAVDYEIEGDYPKFGNDDDRVDEIGVNLVKTFMKKLENIKFIEMLPLLYLFLLSHQMLFMEKILVLLLMEERLVFHLLLVQILFMEEMLKEV